MTQPLASLPLTTSLLSSVKEEGGGRGGREDHKGLNEDHLRLWRYEWRWRCAYSS